MNVIVSNKYQMLLGGVQIDVIKSINGVFTVEDLAAQFKNFFYNRMILDITSLKDYENIATIQNLTLNFDTSKIILLLDDSMVVNSPTYMSQLVSLGIYNFTKSVDSIPFLVNNPNTYKDVARYHQLNVIPEEESNKKSPAEEQVTLTQRVLGIKNLTPHAGSTTLTYLLKKHLEKYYKVKAVEIGKNDFAFFNDENLDYVTEFDLDRYINENSEMEVILIDITNPNAEKFCNDIIYLIEPGLVQLNRLIKENPHVFEDYKNRKIILNRSILNAKDIQDFEKESHCKVFFNVPNVDDKLDSIRPLSELLSNLGFSRFGESGKISKGFSLFH